MDIENKLSRRQFLRISAFGAASAMVVACGGEVTNPDPAGAPDAPAPGDTQATTPPATGADTQATVPATGGDTVVDERETPERSEGGDTAPATGSGQYKEAPMLAEMVEAGDLPPVEERLPKNPYVVPHEWLTTGKYGGTFQTGGAADPWNISGYVHESMYGHSLLRYLKDGQEIGPGLVESWESNDDASEWTLHFREGLKWSDGEPWTTDDIMYWWEDLVLNEDHPEGPPDEARSGKGTLMKLNKVDDLTLQMVFDAPAPLTADRLAMWVNRGIGPQWMVPKHYASQFHPKYNKELEGKADWVDEHNVKWDFARNPECPTMTGWRLVSLEEGTRGQWERNPYYWCVDKEGNQLPYMDRWNVTGYQDAEVFKLSVLEGKVDYDHFNNLPLADVQALKGAQDRGQFEVRFWDSGSGTGSIMFLNYDFKNEKYREVFRMPEFRKALSHAYNRAEVQKGVYFNTGEQTTGTLSPKAIEYLVNDEGKEVYASWRDSAIKYDPEMAKQLLDEIGVKEGAGGKRTLPDGSPLALRLEFGANAGKEHLTKNQMLARDLNAIGIDAKLNPIPPAGFEDQWRAGEGMSHTAWEVGDGPNHLVFPQWLVPLEHERWAPLHGSWYNALGTELENAEEDVDPYERKPPRVAPEEGGPIAQLYKLYDQSKVEPDPMKRHQLVWDMIKIHVDEGPFFMGVVANYPRVVVVKNGLLNVPKREDLALGGFVNPWIHPTPAVYDPETWFFEDPSAHT